MTPQKGRQYLVVRIIRAYNLKPMDNGVNSDPFVSVFWDGMKQSTKVVYKNTSPEFNDTLYFPVRCVKPTPIQLARKGSILLQVFDYDAMGNDFIGDYELRM